MLVVVTTIISKQPICALYLQKQTTSHYSPLKGKVKRETCVQFFSDFQFLCKSGLARL